MFSPHHHPGGAYLQTNFVALLQATWSSNVSFVICGQENRVRAYEGPEKPRIIFLSGVPWYDGHPYSEHARHMIEDFARRAGLRPLDYGYATVLDRVPPGRRLETISQTELETAEAATCARLDKMIDVRVVVPTDDVALMAVSGLDSVEDWHLSIFQAKKLAGVRKCIPLLSPETIFRAYSDVPFFIFGIDRIKEESQFFEIKTTPRLYHIQPTFEEVITYLGRCMFSDYLGIDIETREGQIVCLGLAVSGTEAMSIPTLPSDWSQQELFTIWTWIRDVLEKGTAKKIIQNFIYDSTYLSRYGIAIKKIWHDTMHANKCLHPELTMGLDTIARIYTKEPYWKDEGKDWREVKDIRRFYTYNCKDAAVMVEAAHAQREDLRKRGLERVYIERVAALFPYAAEMSWRGLPIDDGKRKALWEERNNEVAELNKALADESVPLLGIPINPRSHVQVKDFLRAKKFRLPTKRGKETSDVTALLKLQQKYPNEKSLQVLIDLSEKNKAISSYLKPMPYPDGRMRYSMRVCGTDTNRWGCTKDPWDNGFNAQTMPKWYKKAIQAPPGWLLYEVDLKQADARVVAWDANEPTLMRFFNENRDIHRYVASQLFNSLEDAITDPQRQLGKKCGHASNYGMRAPTLVDQCLLEEGLVLSVMQADQMIRGYYRLMSQIPVWHQRIQQELRRTKKLTTPLGRERYFYGRLEDETYRAAYAFKPQSIVCDTIDALIVHVGQRRNPELCHTLAQIHDAGLWLIREDYLSEMNSIVFADKDWNPRMQMPGGTLVIPFDAKTGENLGSIKETH
jgi:DNA polymerase I-like protein with 3'-5' exonuclease and polymerase domains